MLVKRELPSIPDQLEMYQLRIHECKQNSRTAKQGCSAIGIIGKHPESEHTVPGEQEEHIDIEKETD